MCKLFDEWSVQIKEYCEKNGYDFEKAKKLSQCWGKEFVALQFHDPTKGARGLLDDTPAPVVLWIKKNDDGKLSFEKTEYTDRYLRKVS